MKYRLGESIESLPADSLLSLQFPHIFESFCELCLQRQLWNQDRELFNGWKIYCLVRRATCERSKMFAGLHQSSHQIQRVNFVAANPVYKILRCTHLPAHHCDKSYGSCTRETNRPCRNHDCK